MITFTSVKHRYGRRTALADLSFELSPGRIYGFIGPNGAGKSTAFRICAGALKPTSGTVRLFGNASPDDVRVRSRIGFLPERNPCFEEPDVLEHLSHVAALRGLRGSSQKAAIQRAVARCQLAPVLTARVHTLSKGFRQRLGLACAIVHEPDILILDEPINGLDPQQIQAFMALLPVLAENRTLIFSSHILAHLDGICDHLFLLNQGQLAFSGTPQAWFAHDPEAGILIESHTDCEQLLPLLRGWANAEVQPISGQEGVPLYKISGVFSAAQRAELHELCRAHHVSLSRLEKVAPDSDRIFAHILAGGAA